MNTKDESLAQPEQEPVACRFCHDKKGCWTWQCYSCGEIDDVQKPAPPAAPMQEPVAYLCENGVGHRYFRWKKPSDIYKPIALYTTSPAAQRPWVGLTKVQRDDFADAYGSYEAVCAIEQRLKELNT